MWIKQFKRIYIYHFVYIIIYTHTYIIEMSRCVLSNSPTVQIHYLPLWATCLSEVKETWIYIYIYIYIYMYIYIDIFSFTSRYHCCVFVDGLMTLLFFQDFLFYLQMSSAKWQSGVYVVHVSMCKLKQAVRFRQLICDVHYHKYVPFVFYFPF